MIDRSMSLPMPVKVRPYAHQQAGYDFACRIFGLYDGRIRSHGVAFLMEMGTGKTLTSIGVTGALYQFGLVNRVLVACPLSITGVWEDESQAFADYPVNITVLKGTSEKKKQQISKIPSDGLQVLIVNYESAWRLEAELLKFDADLIIADEGHKLKDNRSRQSKGMQHLGDKARYKLLLTGTVITNREMDVFSQYRFLDSRIFGTSFYAFRNRYFDMTGYGNHIPVFRQSMADDFLKRMHCIAYRVTKEECLDLPQLREEVRKIELEPKAMKMYEQLQEDCFTQLKGSEVTAANVLTKMLRLSQLTGGHLTDDEHHVRPVSHAKLDALSDIIDAAVSDGQKLVVMARFVAEMDDIEELLKGKGIGYAVVRGGVKDRDDEVKQFQTDPSCQVFVGQIAAAGLGITLTAAHTMVFYSLDYSMSNFDQAKARIHRVGQKQKCLYIYLIARGTVDSKVLRSLRKKVNLAKALVDDDRNGRNPFNE